MTCKAYMKYKYTTLSNILEENTCKNPMTTPTDQILSADLKTLQPHQRKNNNKMKLKSWIKVKKKAH